MKRFLLIFIITSVLFISCKSTEVSAPVPEPSSSDKALEFTEIWAYLMQTEENLCSPSLPVTDIGYFVKAVNNFSEIEPVPARDKYFSQYNCRIHVVTSCDSAAQTHLLLDPSLPLRKRIIDSLVKESKDYDGIQVDWELIKPQDKENFMSFLTDLKKKMNGKILSVAIPARVKKLTKDAYDYEDLSKIADKIIIMAYDEHWSTSTPGPVASAEWCAKVSDYAVSAIPSEKLVMGLPFYGRTWRDDKDGGKAYKFNTMKTLLEEKDIDIKRDTGNVANFTFTKKLTIEGWFDDALSLYTKCEMYSGKNVSNISFWRIGQEDPYFWQYLKIKKPAE